jgi:hypothetical protein
MQRWDRMDHHVDFRSYYASVIDGWLGGGSGTMLGGNFENLGLFAHGPGVAGAGSTPLPPAVVTPKSLFNPVDPVRVADTRDGTGGVPVGAIAAAARLSVKVAGVGGVPASGATAVVANVMAVDASQPMFFTVYPGSTARPETSNINGGPGRPVPNLVVMGIGSDGCIDVYNSHGTTHCLVDVFGYFTPGTGDGFTPLSPKRLFDTRIGTGAPQAKLRAGSPLELQVAGAAGVPATGATAVVMNLTATETESPGFLRLTPSGREPAETSNVNFFAGDTVPNLVICKLGTDGRVILDSAGDGVHALGDVFGYFGEAGDRSAVVAARLLKPPPELTSNRSEQRQRARAKSAAKPSARMSRNRRSSISPSPPPRRPNRSSFGPSPNPWSRKP